MKTCSKCNTEKAKTEFYKGKKYRDGHQPWCKQCSNEARMTSYYKDPAPNRINGALRIKRNIAHVASYLRDHPCVDCSEDDIVVLEFDHVRGVKLGNISNMARAQVSLEVLDTEIAKCEVRCANCHRRVTYKRRKELVIVG